MLNLAASVAASMPTSTFYRELNAQSPFVVSCGCAMSQTHHSANTAHPDAVLASLQKTSKTHKDSQGFLTHKDRIGYVRKSLPNITCPCGFKFNPLSEPDQKILTKVMLELTIQGPNQAMILNCPNCRDVIKTDPRQEIKLTAAHQQAMLSQIEFLGVKNQAACTNNGLPTYRISLEASDVLTQNSTDIDPAKLKTQAAFLQCLGNPLVFCHHYANPQAIPDLFEKAEHAAWFAKYCASIAQASPQITHICPISQPVGFAHRVSRGSLPPFKINIALAEYLKNITNAQVQACQEMKKINPNLKVLMSHQWKPMKPLHGIFSPWYALEKLICTIADRMYNGAFVKMLQPHQDLFDGIALSIYPALYFNGWVPSGDNCAGNFSADDALEAIMQTHTKFPTKDIYIVETGCNTADPETKKAFIDMTLHVCKIAREKNVSIKGVYFWGQTNDPEFYSEWNLPQGSTNFAPFDKLDPANPCGSVNASGLYLQEILKA
ncbi:hypothetical protein A3J41_00105 [candidate division TM6 bacterium RIFCSPHIGHO2_12_FULL_38_8]|nr:MAG: hypothetical protein A3J41_00105 [candidate division TM6 bacterium RIFCSPHIGHO2_12_FULL_38_8]